MVERRKGGLCEYHAVNPMSKSMSSLRRESARTGVLVRSKSMRYLAEINYALVHEKMSVLRQKQFARMTIRKAKQAEM